jgi:hypothetical protein
MSTQPNMPGVPAVAAGAGRGTTQEERLLSDTADDGTPVGAADADADAERSGAGNGDQGTGEAGAAGVLDGDVLEGADDAVPVGQADVEADRLRSGADADPA